METNWYKWIVMVVGTGASEAFGPFRTKEKAVSVRDWLQVRVADDVEVALEELSRPTHARLAAWDLQRIDGGGHQARGDR